MQTEDYKNAIWNIIDELQKHREEHPGRYVFSDIEDAAGNQYVDLVQEGGGMLGIALAGYTYVLEAMGIRFLSLAGTSAGAINTLLMASLNKPEKAKSEKILEILTTTNFSEFVDGGGDANQLVNAFLKEKSGLTKLFAIIKNYPELTKELGLNPGDAFKDWLDGHVKQKTTKSLEANMCDLPEMFLIDRSRRGHPREPVTSKIKESIQLAIVSADITTQTKVRFPEMAELYYKNPDAVNPVEFARASMSIPGFFQPHAIPLDEINRSDHAYREKWKTLAGFTGMIPEKAIFMDGGIMSNFPIDAIFSVDTIGYRPVFGVKLGVDREKAHEINSVAGLVLGCFNSARNLRDFEFLFNDPTFKDLIAYVNVGEHNWIDFNLTDDAKLDLFVRGAKAASDFLRDFDWQAYKQDRKKDFLRNIRSKHSWLLDAEDVIRKFDLGKECHYKLSELRNRGFKVLWIDDDYTNDCLEITVLERLSIHVYPVNSSREAKLVLDKEEINLIITDSNRENNPLEGVFFAKELLEDSNYEGIPVILHSITLQNELMSVKDWPKNIVNRTGKRDMLVLKDLVLEVVETLCGEMKPVVG